MKKLPHQLPTISEIDRVLASKSFLHFVKLAWPIVEPTNEFQSNWHIEAICLHLEAVTKGKIPRLIINIPPRHMKSLLVTVFWPVWVWTFWPSARWLFTSYADNLAIRDSLKCRSIIESEWYQANWGERVILRRDQNQKSRFDNSATGYRIASGVGGLGTGEGGDFIIVDDPIKAADAHSEASRLKVNTWWDETMSTRANSPRGTARVIIMQRLHEDDLTGYILTKARSEDGVPYEHLCLPAEYDPERKCRTSLGWEDPRTEPGELLWPERFDRESIETLKRELGSYGTAGQLQQVPAPLGGSMFKRENFQIVSAAPATAKRVLYIDKAGTQDGGAYSVALLLAMTPERRFFVEDIVRGQWGALERENIIHQTVELLAHKYGVNGFQVWLEQEPGSGGKESVENSIRKLAGYSVYADRPSGDKTTRAQPISAQVEAKNVFIVKGDWNFGFLDRLSLFPNGKYRDEIDALSGAFNNLALAPEPKIARAR